MKNKFGLADCTKQNQEIHLRFLRYGNYESFVRLVDEFKLEFPDRFWQDDRWVIPASQRNLFETFCERHGLKIRWDSINPTQISYL
ncbi:MAG: hypothetical protein H6636_14225 [Anaerolineales bacterium]|nr:hypothetical protein [Anaerolineales bacterium]